MSTVIFLGAGASAAEGAPIQSKLFYEYFNSLDITSSTLDMNRELATFFHLMFGINVDDRERLKTAAFPTFEEALGILDLAERRKESLKDFDLENLATNSNRIRFIRQYLIMLMAKVLHDKLEYAGTKHSSLVKNLTKAKRIQETVPIIVPPTYFKEMSNVFLIQVWHKAEQALRQAENVIFCGYSFPDADMHVKYLLKRAQTNRKSTLRFTVMNNHRGKNRTLAKEEVNRYKRFLGAAVSYTDKSFDDLVDSPVSFL